MAISRKIRSCDKFGAQFALSYDGKTTFTTLGGGIASILLHIAILFYFCLRMQVLINY